MAARCAAAAVFDRKSRPTGAAFRDDCSHLLVQRKHKLLTISVAGLHSHFHAYHTTIQPKSQVLCGTFYHFNSKFPSVLECLTHKENIFPSSIHALWPGAKKEGKNLCNGTKKACSAHFFCVIVFVCCYIITRLGWLRPLRCRGLPGRRPCLLLAQRWGSRRQAARFPPVLLPRFPPFRLRWAV